MKLARSVEGWQKTVRDCCRGAFWNSQMENHGFIDNNTKALFRYQQLGITGSEVVVKFFPGFIFSFKTLIVSFLLEPQYTV